MEYPREPTAEECSQHVSLGDGWFALWYPQMGGYVGKAVARQVGECFDLYVWHDGEFPFSDDDVDGWTEQPKCPVLLHHCDSEQFRRLADDLEHIGRLSVSG